MMKMLIAGLALIAIMTSCGGITSANYKATLLGSSEVPPVPTNSNMKAVATATLDIGSSVLKINGTYGYLSGPVTAQHIRGPGGVGEIAPIVFTLTSTATAAQGSFTGTFTLSRAAWLCNSYSSHCRTRS